MIIYLSAGRRQMAREGGEESGEEVEEVEDAGRAGEGAGHRRHAHRLYHHSAVRFGVVLWTILRLETVLSCYRTDTIVGKRHEELVGFSRRIFPIDVSGADCACDCTMRAICRQQGTMEGADCATSLSFAPSPLLAIIRWLRGAAGGLYLSTFVVVVAAGAL